MAVPGRDVITIEGPLCWRDVDDVANGKKLRLSPAAVQRVATGRTIVDAIVDRGIRAYGVNTGVGALSDIVVDRHQQRRLSRNLLMSHACGVGDPLDPQSVRAIIAAQVNNFAHGRSGIRPETVALMLALLDEGVIPEVPARGSVGYLIHMAPIGLVLIGEGHAVYHGERLSGADVLSRIGRTPAVLEAKEGLSLINGTPCSIGLGAMALARAERLMAWSDAVASLSLEVLGCQVAAFAPATMAALASPSSSAVAADLCRRLSGSGIVARAEGVRTQDALSLRAVPHAHGAARDVFATSAATLDRMLAAVTDNPMVAGTPQAPIVLSEAHAVSPALGQALDSLSVAVAQVAAMSERRLDRLINPLVSGLPQFLAADPGAGSGFMIAQYTAAGLVCENRRLAAPASLDGGMTSGLQEDFLAHPTAAAQKCLAIIDNAAAILGIELLAACEAEDILAPQASPAPGTAVVHAHVRRAVGRYEDDRPLSWDMALAKALIMSSAPPECP